MNLCVCIPCFRLVTVLISTIYFHLQGICHFAGEICNKQSRTAQKDLAAFKLQQAYHSISKKQHVTLPSKSMPVCLEEERCIIVPRKRHFVHHIIHPSPSRSEDTTFPESLNKTKIRRVHWMQRSPVQPTSQWKLWREIKPSRDRINGGQLITGARITVWPYSNTPLIFHCFNMPGYWCVWECNCNYFVKCFLFENVLK